MRGVIVINLAGIASLIFPIISLYLKNPENRTQTFTLREFLLINKSIIFIEI